MHYFITGGAGFIGSNMVDRLLSLGTQVTVYDNFSTGRHEFVQSVAKYKGFQLIAGDTLDKDALTKAMAGSDFVFHFALTQMYALERNHPTKDLEQNNIHAVMHMALEQARREGLLYRNPADDVKLPTAKPIEHTIPEPEQLQALLAELRGAECYLAILTCTLLACRRGEALGLFWDDIDFDACTVELKRALIVNNLTNTVQIGELKTKNSRRTLPLPAALRDALLNVKQEKEQEAKVAGSHVVDSPFVFTTVSGKPFRPDSISQAFKRAALKVGLPDMRLHDLRHTGITYMLVDGADEKQFRDLWAMQQHNSH